MGAVIGIDPGRRTGWALFREGVLTEAGVFKAQDLSSFQPAVGSGVALIEKPVIYPARNVPSNDLIDLAVVVGELSALCRFAGYKVKLVAPRTWKGSVPKSIHNKRVLSVLTVEEVEKLPRRPRAGDYDHNMLDAVGLALWHLKRSLR